MLVEGNSRVSSAIKYLTQSTWSHAALFVGEHLAQSGGNPQHCVIKADTVERVRSIGLEAFGNLHARVCRPVGLTDDDCRKVSAYAISRLGSQYDLRNVIDLARYLFPTPPVPLRFRRRLLSLGSGDPT
ncbi:MAG: lipo-like protein, partial [Burkholderiaceae bacterium]